MEHEIRFCYALESLSKLKEMLEAQPLKQCERVHELTCQYEHCDPRFSFYSAEVDGRLRVRISKGSESAKCTLGWKQRTAETFRNAYNSEIEEEVRFNSEDVDKLFYILEKPLHFQMVDSYERYRTVYEDEDVSISIDEFPFGIVLEIESKKEQGVDAILRQWTDRLKLNQKDAYPLSWDDKYRELCLAQGMEPFAHVRFGQPMPRFE